MSHCNTPPGDSSNAAILCSRISASAVVYIPKIELANGGYNHNSAARHSTSPIGQHASHGKSDNHLFCTVNAAKQRPSQPRNVTYVQNAWVSPQAIKGSLYKVTQR